MALWLLGMPLIPGWGAAGTATVDGIGGAETADPSYPLSYATVNAALAAVRLAENDVAPGNVIRITPPALAEAAGLDLNTLESLIIESTAPGGTHLKIAPSGIGISGTQCAIKWDARDGRNLTLRDLIITPDEGAAGAVMARALQVVTSSDLGYTMTVDRCWFTAIRPTGHAEAGQAILNPFVHAASANTIAARNAELRAFDGGAAAGLVDLRAPSGAQTKAKIFTFRNTVFTHSHGAANANRGAGISIAHQAAYTLNIEEGCVFSYLAQAGARTSGSLPVPATTQWNVLGTPNNPVFSIHNGWAEDVSTSGRGEGFLVDGVPLIMGHVYAVGNHHEALEKAGAGDVAISNSYFADGQSDLDTGNGSAPNVSGVATLRLSGSGDVSLTSVTVFRNRASTHDVLIGWSAPSADATFSATNVIAAGADDQINIGGAVAVDYLENNCAIVTAGAFATDDVTLGAGVTASVNDRVTADPVFQSTVFAPVWTGLGSLPGNLDNYLSVHSSAYKSGAAGRNVLTSRNVTGANTASPLPVTVSQIVIE